MFTRPYRLSSLGVKHIYARSARDQAFDLATLAFVRHIRETRSSSYQKLLNSTLDAVQHCFRFFPLFLLFCRNYWRRSSKAAQYSNR